MIKRTIYIGNPAKLNVKERQLILKDVVIPYNKNDCVIKAEIPIEDIGFLILDNPQITLTQPLLNLLAQNNAVIISCDEKHMPFSITLPLAQNTTFSQKIRFQLEASEPLKKQLWRQIIIAKLQNQCIVLKKIGHQTNKIEKMIPKVNSGDPENYEAQAAAIYWEKLFKNYDVTRGRFDGGPNVMFNFGYAILRSVIARSLVGSGCFTILGIHHKNKYNPHCLADDIMEPYRPIVDQIILDYLSKYGKEGEDLTKTEKEYLLQIPAIDVVISKKSSPLMIGAQQTTSSLAKCYEGKLRKIKFPEIVL